MMVTGWATPYDVNERDNTHREKNNTLQESSFRKESLRNRIEVILSALCNLRKYFGKARGHVVIIITFPFPFPFHSTIL